MFLRSFSETLNYRSGSVVEIVGCIVFKLPSDNVDHSHHRYVLTKFNRTVSRFGTCASYDEAHPILLYIKPIRFAEISHASGPE